MSDYMFILSEMLLLLAGGFAGYVVRSMRPAKYVYGNCGPVPWPSRRRHDGVVEYLSTAPDPDDLTCYWYEFNSTWWSTFTPYPDQ